MNDIFTSVLNEVYLRVYLRYEWNYASDVMHNSVLSYELFILYLGLDLRQVVNGTFVVLYSFPSTKEVYEKKSNHQSRQTFEPYQNWTKKLCWWVWEKLCVNWYMKANLYQTNYTVYECSFFKFWHKYV